MYNAIWLDVTQFASEPIRTGVQRVLIKIIENLPPAEIMPFRVLDRNHIAVLDPVFFDIAIRFFKGATFGDRADTVGNDRRSRFSSEEWLLKTVSEHPMGVIRADRFFHRAQRIVNLEAFDGVERSAFYKNCPDAYRNKVYHFIHDFLLFEKPEVFPQLDWRKAANLVDLLDAYSCAGGYMVSTPSMAEKVATYLNKPAESIYVVPFGGDAIAKGPKAGEVGSEQGRRQKNHQVLVLGTIEPRKYPLEVVQALDQLADRGIKPVIVGSWGWVSQDTRAAIQDVLDNGGIELRAGVGDNELLRLLSDTSVAIYVSSAEGFGLPVVEFASLGIPVVTNTEVPAAHVLQRGPFTVLSKVTTSEIVIAVETLLSTDSRGKQYYAPTWADSGKALISAIRWKGGAEHDVTPLLNGWQISIDIRRNLRQESFGWEELKVAVGNQLEEHLLRIGTPLLDGQIGEGRSWDEFHEYVSEVVSDNLYTVYWADLLQLRPILSRLIEALTQSDHLEALNSAFITLLGRPIDTRAAAEVISFGSMDQRLNRIIELVHSQEAFNNLGEQMSTALRYVFDRVGGLLKQLFSEKVDLFAVFSSLGIAEPSLDDVYILARSRTEGRHILDVFMGFAERRNLQGDVVDLLLDCIASLYKQRRNGFRLPWFIDGQKALNENAHVPNVSPQKLDVNESERLLTLPVSSPLLQGDWYDPEKTDDGYRRWMGHIGGVSNPRPDLPVKEVLFFIREAYGTDEPKLTGGSERNSTNMTINVERVGEGWLARLAPRSGTSHIGQAWISSLIMDAPSRVENSSDTRELSICVEGVAFVYSEAHSKLAGYAA